ncbi:dehydrogenase E1 component subunit alpha/beta [Candidatus Woesearchaeota archaeon]|nr:dehydrogenase E1 component subunit alpha/beta [Candidatus Woesearchaeota archaeon]
MESTPDSKVLLELYSTMLLIRRTEEKIAERYSEQEMRCPTHLCTGQEAVPAGVCLNLTKEDNVLSNHRAHGHYIAKGGNINAMIAEIYGKETGCSRGRGGSMHLTDLSVNFVASTAIVGGTIPLAVGTALASRMQNKKDVAVAFFGDSAVEGGVFHEALNFAALHKLPVLFVCENNLYASQTHIRERQPEREITQLAKSQGIAAFKEDGNDAVAVYTTAKKAVEHARSGNGPVFLEFPTYRWLEHVGPNDDSKLGYRSEKEIQEWKARDPLERLKKTLLENSLATEKNLKSIDDEAKQKVDEAFRFAKGSPFPKKETLHDYLYCNTRHNINQYPVSASPGKERKISYAEAVREATGQAMEKDSSVFVIGEGVPDPKHVFGTTTGLREKHGRNRVLDMPVSENGLTGVCIGAALKGMKPLMVHQRMDFLLLALDQLVNNAAKWHYMFGGHASVPIVIRAIVGQGWGQGAQHSQSLHSVLSHIPGLKVVMPSNAYDAKGLLMASIEDNNPVVFIEHRWLHNITGYVPEEPYALELGKAKAIRQGNDLTIVAASYMTVEAVKAASALEGKASIEIIDLRTVKPLDFETIKHSVEKTGRLLVVDSGHYSGGLAGDIIARVMEQSFNALKAAPRRITLPDLPTPTSPELSRHYYPSRLDIIKDIGELAGLPAKEIRAIIESERQKMPEKPDVPDPGFKGPF